VSPPDEFPVHAFDFGRFQLRGRAVGGVETCYEVPTWDLNLDIGRCPPGAERQGTLLLTHGHIDHAAGLPYYVSLRALYGMPPPTIFCPRSAEGPLRDILAAWARLQTDSERCDLVGLDAGDAVPLGPTRFVRAFSTPHRIHTLGYTVFERVRKLKPELRGLPADAIRARAQAGEPVDDVIERPELCFPGDTRISVLDRDPSVATARVLLLECTFVGPDVKPDKAHRGGHVHLDDIAAHADRFENEHVVLVHFSQRYGRSQVEREVAARLPEGLRSRVRLMV
jgi:ribonuclease Z